MSLQAEPSCKTHTFQNTKAVALIVPKRGYGSIHTVCVGLAQCSRPGAVCGCCLHIRARQVRSSLDSALHHIQCHTQLRSMLITCGACHTTHLRQMNRMSMPQAATLTNSSLQHTETLLHQCQYLLPVYFHPSTLTIKPYLAHPNRQSLSTCLPARTHPPTHPPIHLITPSTFKPYQQVAKGEGLSTSRCSLSSWASVSTKPRPCQQRLSSLDVSQWCAAELWHGVAVVVVARGGCAMA